MKNTLVHMSRLAASLAASLFLLLTGCISVRQRPQKEAVYDMVNAAAHGGTLAYLLEQDPEKRGSKAQLFESAAVALEILSDKDTITMRDLAAILDRLPIKELKSKTAIILISTTRVTLSRLEFSTNVPENVDKYDLKRIAKELHLGIRSGMLTAIGVSD